MNADFINPKLSLLHLDTYIVRKAIVNSVTAFLPVVKGVVLDLGCGSMPYRSLLIGQCPEISAYVGVDIPSDIYNRPDIYWDGVNLPFRDCSIDTLLATEVLEHCPRPELVLAEVFRVLRPGARALFTVPFLWPLHDIPHDEFRFTPFAMRRLLMDAGLGQIDVRALGGWDASLAQMIGLWVQRRPIAPVKRKIVALAALPVMRALLARDRTTDFDRSPMLTGLCATARKPGADISGQRPAMGSFSPKSGNN